MITRTIRRFTFYAVLLLALASVCSLSAWAQGLGAGTVTGTVIDPNNAAIPSASVTLANAVTGYKRTATSDENGAFRFNNVPPNTYQLSVSATGFNAATQTLDVRTSVPISIKIPMTVAGTSETVTVKDFLSRSPAAA